MIYELWDMETDNLINDYDDEAAALAVVRDTVERYGLQAAETLALLCERSDGRGPVETLAMGIALVERASVTMLSTADR